jgi:predicted MPP superfamily phosphohydrolase
LAVGGLFLLGCILQAQYLLLPGRFEAAGHLLYRIAFFVVLPFRLLVNVFLPGVGHHWPLSHFMWTCLGTPFFLWGTWRLYHTLIKHWRLHRAERIRARTIPPLDIARRQFLVRSTIGALGVVTGGVGGYASLVEPERLRLRTYDIPIRNLPREFDGLRIVHISDTHYGPYTRLSYLESVVAKVNDLKPDLVFLTGDYVHYTPLAVNAGIHLFASLRKCQAIVGVLGNHDHWEGVEACRMAFEKAGLPLIDNRRLFLTPGGLSHTHIEGHSLCLAGVGDLWEDTVSFKDALHDVPETVPRLLLSHNPDAAESLDPAFRVDLMFSGHTHGGQVNLPGLGAVVTPSKYGAKYLGGLCRGPRCPVVVSRGIGLAGIPARFRVPPELGVIVLAHA